MVYLESIPEIDELGRIFLLKHVSYNLIYGIQRVIDNIPNGWNLYHIHPTNTNGITDTLVTSPDIHLISIRQINEHISKCLKVINEASITYINKCIVEWVLDTNYKYSKRFYTRYIEELIEANNIYKHPNFDLIYNRLIRLEKIAYIDGDYDKLTGLSTYTMGDGSKKIFTKDEREHYLHSPYPQ